MKSISAVGVRALLTLAMAGGIAVAALPSADTGLDPQNKSGFTTQSTTQPTTQSTTKAGAQTAQHPSHLHAALHELKQARHELKEAKHDYGGHREKALEAVDHAIHQLEKAVHYHQQHK
jgi:hypothetical protein